MAKYARIAERNGLQFAPAAFFHTGQAYSPFKSLIKEQIRRCLIDFEGHAKTSKIKSVMKWWSKCISMIIAKTASRNVAFKSGKLAESVFTSQADILTRQLVTEDSSNDNEVYLYIFNQDDRQD